MIIAVTGHRPNKLGGYLDHAKDKLRHVAKEMLCSHNPSLVLTGMALGLDQAVAEACCELWIPFVACVPFEGQESAWPQGSQRRYRGLLAAAKQVVIVSPGGYSADKMQVRNEYMVDNCQYLVALWDGTSGGTGNCVEYAEKVGKPWVNLYDYWRCL